MNKKTFLLGITTVGVLVVGFSMYKGIEKSSLSSNVYQIQRGGGSYSLVLDKNNVPATITSSYVNLVAGTVKTTLNHDVGLSFVNAKSLANGFVQLANHGKIFNFAASGNNQLTAVNGISFTGSGSLLFKPVAYKTSTGAVLADVTPISVSAGSSKVTVPTCDFFELEAGDSGASITSMELFYSCDPEAIDIKLLNGTYTGIGSDTSTYKLVVNNGSASIQSLDKQTNISLEGSAVMLDKDTAKCTFVYNTYNIYYTMDFDGHSLSFVSKTDDVGGAAASQVAQVSFDRVYNVEDFQSYTASGTGYVSADAKYTTTGLRSQYYADYYTGSGSGEIGGSGWPIMTSTDNSTYNSQKGHNSSKVGIFKFSNGMGMRYISMNELYGVNSLIGKGSTLSFWARGAYTNTYFDTNHASNTEMKFYAFYDSPLTPSNQSTKRETFDFTVQAGSTWQHFEMPLTSGREYYGFGFYAKQSSGSTQYVPFDDIQIYTASPYAEYVAPVSVTGVSVSPTQLALTTGGSSQIAATVAPSNATNKNVTWSTSANAVATVDPDGTVHAVSAGNATVTVTTADGGYTATCSVTVSAPATYYPEGTYKGTASISSYSADLVLAFGNSSNGLIGVRVSNTDMIPGSVSYNSANNTFSITTTGTATFGSYSFTTGTITGTYDYANDRLTNINCSGSIGSYVSNLTATKPTANYWDCDGTTSQLQSLFKRRYMSGSWQVDSSNADRITSNTTQYVSGSGAAKRRGYSGGAVALNFNSDFSSAITVKNVHFWVYNPHTSDIELRMWGYKAKNFESNFETGSVTAKKGQWTYLAMGFTSAAIYNFQIADFNNTGAYLTFDNIYLF